MYKNDNKIMDVLFSFLSSSSEKDPGQILDTQNEILNLFSDYRNVHSRATAGTTSDMPSQMMEATREAVESTTPKLLAVSCGYFTNIMRHLITKERKRTMKYCLIDSDGMIFDKLLENLDHHSLSDLLIEMMQLSFPNFKTQLGCNDDEFGSLSETANTTFASEQPELSDEQKLMRTRL